MRDAAITKAAVQSGLGAGLLAEMAAGLTEDSGLRAISLPGLFPRCVAWAVLRRDRVLRDYVAELLATLSGHSARRRLAEDGGSSEFDLAQVPLWSDIAKVIAPPFATDGGVTRD